jgi:hypothetical protein
MVAWKSIIAAEAADRQPKLKTAAITDVRNMDPPYVAVGTRCGAGLLA